MKLKHCEIAKKLGMSPPVWCMKYKGRRKITVYEAEKLSKLFGKNPVWWMKATPDQIRTAIKKVA